MSDNARITLLTHQRDTARGLLEPLKARVGELEEIIEQLNEARERELQAAKADAFREGVETARKQSASFFVPRVINPYSLEGGC